MKIVSILLQVIGVSAGVLLGLWLKAGGDADASADETHQEDDAHGDEESDDGHGKKKKKKKKDKGGHGEESSGHGDEGGDDSNSGFMKFSRQFIVPVIRTDNVNALVVIDINLEISPTSTQKSYSREPKVRDALLTALLRLSNEGAFGPRMLVPENTDHIRAELLSAAQSILGDDATNVLILSIARQDF